VRSHERTFPILHGLYAQRGKDDGKCACDYHSVIIHADRFVAYLFNDQPRSGLRHIVQRSRLFEW
jgi:hypothetical protein